MVLCHLVAPEPLLAPDLVVERYGLQHESSMPASLGFNKISSKFFAVSAGGTVQASQLHYKFVLLHHYMKGTFYEKESPKQTKLKKKTKICMKRRGRRCGGFLQTALYGKEQGELKLRKLM